MEVIVLFGVKFLRMWNHLLFMETILGLSLTGASLPMGKYPPRTRK